MVLFLTSVLLLCVRAPRQAMRRAQDEPQRHLVTEEYKSEIIRKASESISSFSDSGSPCLCGQQTTPILPVIQTARDAVLNNSNSHVMQAPARPLSLPGRLPHRQNPPPRHTSRPIPSPRSLPLSPFQH